MTKKLNRGRLSNLETKYIQDNVHEQTFDEIATFLNREPESIRAYIENKLGIHPTLNETAMRIVSLREKPVWKSLEKQFSQDELKTFEFNWYSMNEQFHNDVLPSEEQQIIDVIRIDILMGRNMIEQRNSITFVSTIRDEINQLKDGIALDKRDNKLIVKLNSQLDYIISARTTLTKDFREFQDRKNKLWDTLKATRNQRIERIESSKQSFNTWLGQIIDSPERRRDLGRKMEKERLACETELRRLTEYHTYEDDTVDRPFLTPETVGEDDWIN